jgi:hypothetical protein
MSRFPNPETLRGTLSPNARAWLDSIDDNTWLTRPEGSLALKELEGLDVSPATLASLATRGGGPPYRVFMGVAKSQWRDLRRWGLSRSVYRSGEVAA